MARPRSNIIRIDGWSLDLKRRSRRFRCQGCARLIADGSDIVIERRPPGGSHGYHAACFDGSTAGEAALSRDHEHMNPTPR